MGVVAELAMKGRPVAERAVDQVCLLRAHQRIYVGLHRAEQRRWRVGMGAEDRLTTDHHEVALPDDIGRSSDDVLEFDASHQRISRRIFCRSASLSIPAKGEF